MELIKSYLRVFKTNPYSLYVLFVLFLTFMLDQLDRYALPITSIELAQTLEYGDKSCLRLSTQPKSFTQICSKFTKNETS